MMNELERERLQVEILGLEHGKAERRFQIKERLADIKRIEENIKLIEDRQNQIKKLIAEGERHG